VFASVHPDGDPAAHVSNDPLLDVFDVAGGSYIPPTPDARLPTWTVFAGIPTRKGSVPLPCGASMIAGGVALVTVGMFPVVDIVPSHWARMVAIWEAVRTTPSQ